MNRIRVARWDELEDRKPAHALVADVDLVVEQRQLVKLGDDELDVVPFGQLVARHAHRR